MGLHLVSMAEKYLWEKAPHAVCYLLKRGFTEETIRRAKLGYIPLGKDGKWFTRSFADWGLTDDMLTEKQKEKGCVKVPPGILIPWFADNHLWKLAIKRFEASDKEMKYGQVIGSKDALYNADSLARGKPVILCEGEFDVLSVVQEAGDLAAVIGTGSAQKGRLPLWIARIASLATIKLLSFDLDEAGTDACQYWHETFSDTMVWLPFSHDINDMLKEKKDIRSWVQTGLEIATYKPAQPERRGVAFDTLSEECCICGKEVDHYSLDYVAYCEEHWQALHQSPAPVEEKPSEPFIEITCPKCRKHYLHNLTLPRHPKNLCHWCQFDEHLPQILPPT